MAQADTLGGAVMTKIRLHGALGQECGQEHEIAIRQPREAIAAIEANTGKLYRYLRAVKGTEYRVIINGTDHGCVADLYLVGEYDLIEIVPVPMGSGGGVWQAILGVVLIIVGAVLTFIPGFQAVGYYVIGAGIAMLAGGVAQMLSPSPKLGTNSFARTFRPQSQTLQQPEEERSGRGGTQSYLFSGAANTQNPGGPVTLIYGQMIVGSHLVSMAITASSVDSAVIGGSKPAPPDDGFYDLAMWDRLEADDRRAWVPDQKTVKKMPKADVLDRRVVFGIPEVYPAADQKAGKPIPVGTSTMPRRTLRRYLSTISHLFTRTPRGIDIKEARDLYRVLELTTLTNPATATWKQIIKQLALHFSPDP